MTDIMRENRDTDLTAEPRQKTRSSHSKSKTEARNDSDLKSKTKRRDSTSPDEGIAHSSAEIESSPTSSRQKLERKQGQLIQIDIKGGICKESRTKLPSKHSRRKPRGNKTPENVDKLKSEEVLKTQNGDLLVNNGRTKSHKKNTNASTMMKANKLASIRVDVVKEPLTKITTSNSKTSTYKHVKSTHKKNKSTANPNYRADKAFDYAVNELPLGKGPSNIDKTKVKQVKNERKNKQIHAEVCHQMDRQHKSKSQHNKKIKDTDAHDRRVVDKEAPRTLRHRGATQEVSQRCRIDKKYNFQDAVSRSRKKTVDNVDTRNVSEESSCSELSNYSSESESYFSENSQSQCSQSSYASTETESSTSSLSSTVLFTSSSSSESDAARIPGKSSSHRRTITTHQHKERQSHRRKKPQPKNRERTKHVYQHNKPRTRTPVARCHGNAQHYKSGNTKPLQRQDSSHGNRLNKAKSVGKVQKHAQEEKSETKKSNTDDQEFEINLEQRRKKLKNLRINSDDDPNQDLKKKHWQHQQLVLTSQIATPTDSRPKEKVKKNEGHSNTTRQISFEASAKDSNGAVLTIRDLYSLHHVLSDTQNGTVIAGHRRKDGLRVAIKRIAKSGTSRWGWMNGKVVPLELALICQVNEVRHSGVVEIVEWHETTEAFLLVMVRPHPSIDLYDHVTKQKRLKESVARQVIRQVILSLLHCHKMGVLHRDVKLENILYNPVSLETYLIDFGCGDYYRSSPYKEFAGTPEYYPPEWFTSKQYTGDSATVWSVGVLLYSLLCGTLPFRSCKEITSKEITKYPNDLSRLAKEVIKETLQKNPRDRIDLNTILSHPWFKSSKDQRESNKHSV